MEAKKDTPNGPSKVKWITLVVVACLVGIGVWLLPHYLDVEYLASQETKLKSAYHENPWLVLTGAFLLYAVVTGLSIPGAAAMSLLYAWFFGFPTGVVLLSFASTTGATIAFLLSRYLFRDRVEARFGKGLGQFNRSLEREGPIYLFAMRLIPAVPFFAINAVMGLTRMKVFTYWWVSQLGMLTGTILYCYVGSTVPDLASLYEQKSAVSGSQVFQISLAVGLLCLFPIVAKRIFGRFASGEDDGSSRN